MTPMNQHAWRKVDQAQHNFRKALGFGVEAGYWRFSGRQMRKWLEKIYA